MFTFVFNCLGCIARIYTSYAEGGGFVMIRGFVLGVRLPLSLHDTVCDDQSTHYDHSIIFVWQGCC